MNPKAIRHDLASLVIEKLRLGIPPSRLLWNPAGGSGVGIPKRANGEPYRGGNCLQLSLAAIQCGFASPFWFTERQADQLGAELRPGVQGNPILYCGASDKTVKANDGTRKPVKTFFERSYVVFNADQFRGLPLKYHGAFQPEATNDGIPRCDRFFASLGSNVHFGSRSASYSPRKDLIRMPSMDAFIDLESFYSVLCHEHVHWTGHQSRLDRGLDRSWFGDSAYAYEELIAELGAAFFCSEFGVTPAVRDDHISYIGSWLKVLENDDKAIYSAANRASDAIEFLHRYQPQAQPASFIVA